MRFGGVGTGTRTRPHSGLFGGWKEARRVRLNFHFEEVGGGRVGSRRRGVEGPVDVLGGGLGECPQPTAPVL